MAYYELKCGASFERYQAAEFQSHINSCSDCVLRRLTGKIEEFGHAGFHVEIWWNVPYAKYFWVTGHSQRRFQGACEYFASVDLCREDAKRNCELIAKEGQRI